MSLKFAGKAFAALAVSMLICGTASAAIESDRAVMMSPAKDGAYVVKMLGLTNNKKIVLLDGGRKEYDQEKRKAMYQEACQIIYDDAGWDFLAAELYNLGMRENVQGFIPMSTTFFDLSTVYFQ